MDYLEPLNEQQREAVLHFGGPLLILAGAGSGKTRVITTKIAYLIDQKGFDPRSFLAVTFTNKAAEEMKHRVQSMISTDSEVMIRTFHSFGAWLLRRYASVAGLSPNFTIYDEDDKLALLKTFVGKTFAKPDLRFFSNLISRAKDRSLLPGDDLAKFSRDPVFTETFVQYQKKLDEMGNVDFGDLILRPLKLLAENEEIRNRLRGRFSVILVDEFQDSNGAQLELLKLLYSGSNYLCVVGDEDQSIYSFRGACVENIVEFPNIFPGTKVIMLERNYRSTQTILSLAQNVVDRNEYRLGKNLWTELDRGEPVRFAVLADQDEEAKFCAHILEDRRFEGTAILYRNNFQSRAFEALFTRFKIPYRIIGTLKFYEREEVKDVLSYLNLVLNPKDEVSFRRVINKPARGIGYKTLATILSQQGSDPLQMCGNALGLLSAKAKEGIRSFIRIIDETRASLSLQPLSETVKMLIEESGLYDYYIAEDEQHDTVKVDNLAEFVSAVATYPPGAEGLTAFLEATMLNSSEEDPYAVENRVTLITMHNTKGLEFERVFITGLEEELFPHLPESFDRYHEELEEERRLFYVAITRAKRNLYLTSCERRLVYGQYKFRETSRFIEEIPQNLIVQFGARQSGSGYTRGERIFHREYGEGTITNCWTNEGEDFVAVRFSDGRIAQFMPQYTRLEKI
jgi:DNA helicase-2/ATP-dependent DNA helicase PcrA